MLVGPLVRMTSRRDDGIRATQLGELSARRRCRSSFAYEHGDDDAMGASRYRGWVLVDRLGWYEAVNDARRMRMRLRRANVGTYGHAVPSEVFTEFKELVDGMEGETHG